MKERTRIAIDIPSIILLLLMSVHLKNHAAEAHGSAGSTFPASFGASLAFQDSGPKGGTPIVLLHGFPLHQGMWDAQVEALDGHFRVLTYDARGFGKSTVQDGQFTLEILVDDLIALLDYLGIEKAVIAGFSMGGYVALRAMERNPERFTALILVDTQSVADSDAAKLKRTDALKAIKLHGLSVYARQFLNSALSPKTVIGNGQLVDFVADMIESNTVLGVSGGLLALLSRTDTTESLAKIKSPTLILVGEDDAITPLNRARDMQMRIAGARLQVISHAGHLTPIENPAELNAAIVEFLATL